MQVRSCRLQLFLNVNLYIHLVNFLYKDEIRYLKKFLNYLVEKDIQHMTNIVFRSVGSEILAYFHIFKTKIVTLSF